MSHDHDQLNFEKLYQSFFYNNRGISISINNTLHLQTYKENVWIIIIIQESCIRIVTSKGGGCHPQRECGVFIFGHVAHLSPKIACNGCFFEKAFVISYQQHFRFNF